MRYKLSRRSTVLITKGESALSQALISLCLHLDYTVFTTVSNIAKKRFLLRNFPELQGKPNILSLAITMLNSFYTILTLICFLFILILLTLCKYIIFFSYFFIFEL